MSRKKSKKQVPGYNVLLIIVLINLLITDCIIWLWFQYSLVDEWLFNDFKTGLIELLKLFSNEH